LSEGLLPKKAEWDPCGKGSWGGISGQTSETLPRLTQQCPVSLELGLLRPQCPRVCGTFLRTMNLAYIATAVREIGFGLLLTNIVREIRNPFTSCIGTPVLTVH
jgi:hypothetical protein